MRKEIMEELILRSLQGRASVEERRALRQWLSKSTVNEARFQEVARIWALTALSSLEGEDAEAATSRANAFLARVRRSAHGGGRRLLRRGIAAVLVLTLGFALGRLSGVLGSEVQLPAQVPGSSQSSSQR
jgi:ferric-dicitrate binding protein FerR (iron transport regulator)